MVVTAMTGKVVTPAEVGTYANSKGMYACGKGSYHSLAVTVAPHWNLKASYIAATQTAIEKTLKAGGMVWVCGGGSLPFTSGGHCIALWFDHIIFEPVILAEAGSLKAGEGDEIGILTR